MKDAVAKTRFAPSPTGLLHVGGARTALFNWLLARRGGGVFLLRIEDTDAARSRDDYAAALQDDLRWLGLAWGEGPGIAGAHESYFQSRRGEMYRGYFDRLEGQGLAYPCFCSDQDLKLARKSQLAAGRPPRYAGTCAGLTHDEAADRLARGLRPTLRFRVPVGETVRFDDLVRGPQAFSSDDIGDFVVRRSDGTPAFFFCNAIDDSLMGVTDILRGEDHLTNTPRQILLLRALGLRVPCYGHIAMIVGDDGAPLSKRHGSLSIGELRQRGYLAAALINHLARLGHHYEDASFMGMDALAAGFCLAALGRAPARYDPEQLLHWQREAVARAADDALWEWLGDETRTVVPAPHHGAFLEIIRANVLFPAEGRGWAEILFKDLPEVTAAAAAAVAGAAPGFFDHAVAAFDAAAGHYPGLVDELKRATRTKGKGLFMPLRAALTGRTDGPELAHVLTLIPAATARRRLEQGARRQGAA